MPGQLDLPRVMLDKNAQAAAAFRPPRADPLQSNMKAFAGKLPASRWGRAEANNKTAGRRDRASGKLMTFCNSRELAGETRLATGDVSTARVNTAAGVDVLAEVLRRAYEEGLLP